MRIDKTIKKESLNDIGKSMLFFLEGTQIKRKYFSNSVYRKISLKVKLKI
jgi:hypothetical protein